MVDPQLEIEPYLEAAGQKAMRVTHIIETHGQADHVSGARRLAAAVTDHSRGPEPWFVLTGDTLSSGGVGRPDLLGVGAERALAEHLYDSLYRRILSLPDHLEIYPSHFGGAACGKGLSGKAHSTIGFERRFNPALQFTTKAAFVEFVLADLPPQPESFTENRRRNLA